MLNKPRTSTARHCDRFRGDAVVRARFARLTGGSWLCAAAAVAFLLQPSYTSAQELEPGAYWPIPAGLNIATVVNNFNSGDLAFDPAAPIDEASARITARRRHRDSAARALISTVGPTPWS